MAKHHQIQSVSGILTPIPEGWESSDLEGMLISESKLQSRVKVLASEIANQLPSNEPVVVLPLLSGAFLFAADLVRQWQFEFELDFIGLSSYRTSTRSGPIEWIHRVKADIENKHVVIIDDILDTGQTLVEATKELSKLHPATIQTCVLLEKDVKNPRPLSCHANFVGFKIPDIFVVGYGLDFALKFRQLPFVGVLLPNSHGTDAD